MMMLKYWEALREAVHLEFRSPRCLEVMLRDMRNHPLQKRHMYNYWNDSDAKDGDWKFVASPSDEKNYKDISNVEVLERAKPKIQRRRVGTEKGRGSATPESSANRNSIRYANKQQSQL